LSNSRAFVDTWVVTVRPDVRHSDLTVGIPVYAAIDHVHDYVVQAQGAFDDTVVGILQWKDRSPRVEMRVVLRAITARESSKRAVGSRQTFPLLIMLP
jgi:hypothetical protein